MNRSLFARMLFVYLLIIVIAFLLLGGIFFGILRDNYLDRQMDIMINEAKEINVWMNDNYYGRLSNEDFADKLCNKAKSENTVIWLVSNSGTVFIAEDPKNLSRVQNNFSEIINEFLNSTIQGKYVEKVSNVNNAFADTMISVALPLTYMDEEGLSHINGAIIVNKEVSDFNVGLGAIFGQVLFPLTISVAFASILVFILSRYIVMPIKAVSAAAAELSRGNLDFRVKLKTNDEIGELAISFNKMAEELKLQDGLRNTFIANVSHELRTPLAAVQGFIQGMLDGAIEKRDRDKYLEIVLGETKRMSTLITDLLILAKIESGQFPIELSEFDINELIRRCIIMFEQPVEEKRLSVSVDIGEDRLLVWADQDRISQVITNLIDNAVKFSYEGGELRVWTQIVDNKVYVNVSDTGEGIPEEERQNIFERFYKVDKSHSRSKPGTGIGLSIVKRIIAQHGETISLITEVGKGSTFTFSLTKSLAQNEKAKQR